MQNINKLQASFYQRKESLTIGVEIINSGKFIIQNIFPDETNDTKTDLESFAEEISKTLMKIHNENEGRASE